MVSDLVELTAGFHQVPLDRHILRRAAVPFAAPIGALDAIHLATAMVWIEEKSEPLTLLTHDRQLATCAQATGIQVNLAR